MFNANINNNSVISWRSVLLVGQTGIPGENHRPFTSHWWKKPEYPERTTDHGQATGKLDHLRLRVECTFVCYLQSRARTHAVLVIYLYELLDNATTLLIDFGNVPTVVFFCFSLYWLKTRFVSTLHVIPSWVFLLMFVFSDHLFIYCLWKPNHKWNLYANVRQ
jgi:hypothetical protein